MARIVPFTIIPDSATSLDDGTWAVDIQNIESRISSNGNLMYNGAFQTVEPAAYAGAPLFYSFTIGTKDDPTAEDAKTWETSIGAKQFKRMVQRTRLAVNQDMEEAELLTVLKGRRLVVTTEKRKQPDVFPNGKPNPKAGKRFNEITGFFAVGERPLGPSEAKPKPAAIASETQLVCPGCEVQLPASQYGMHMASCTGLTG